MEQNQAPVKFTIGGKEYSSEEAEALVGMGSKVRDFEDRYNTKLDNLMPAYTQATQKLSDYERRIQEEETAAIQSRAFSGQQLTADEQRQAGKQILDQWGYVDKDTIPEILEEQIEGYMIARDVQNFAQQVSSEGKPEVTPQELIMEMQRSGKSMEDSYKNMFPTRLAEWEQSRVNEGRNPGIYTQTSGAQSERSPQATRITSDNIEEMADKALSGEL